MSLLTILYFVVYIVSLYRIELWQASNLTAKQRDNTDDDYVEKILVFGKLLVEFHQPVTYCIVVIWLSQDESINIYKYNQPTVSYQKKSDRVTPLPESNTCEDYGGCQGPLFLKAAC